MRRDDSENGGGRPGAPRNVLGDRLEVCSMNPMTGFFRDGCCDTSREDIGSHTVCAVLTAAFLEFSKSRGNDLLTPIPEVGFPGLRPGDRWCLYASRWQEALEAGQDRVLLVWTRLIMPNGRSIVLERQPGADTQGFAGLEDEVDHHWGRLAMAAALSTVLGVGSELGATNNDNAIVTALRRGGTDSLNQTGQQVVRRNLNIQPTITIRPGFPVGVIVSRDLVLAPYES